ncbi:Rv1157c family protein, partial [Rhodococcoides kroppenstedtii]
EALAALAPSLLDAAAVDAANPQNELLARAKQLLDTAPLSPDAKRILTSIITFLDGSRGGGPEIPQDGPVIAQFLYPTVGRGCISPTADSVGAALAVPGPAELPPPGPAAGTAGFVFTALGTAPLADRQAAPLTAQWVNVDTGRTGATVLTGAANINPDGPATLSAIADTGRGRVLAAISGSISTDAGITCSFLPTVGAFVVN